MDLAIRGLLFFGALIGAFVLAFATDLGDAIDRLQAGGPHGSYSPKLTFLVLLLIAGVPALVAYFPLRLLVVNRFPD